jgi:hypothetical protein
MSWKNYEHQIVHEHQVVLENWPSVEFNPGLLGTKELETVMKALEDGDCAWRKLTDEEVVVREHEATSAHVPTKKRKQRSDKGKKRGPYPKKHKISSDSDDSDTSSSQGESYAPVSAEYIDSSNDM